MSEPFIVSVHVPKTAGTSLALVLDRCFDRRIIYDYQDYAQPQVAAPEVRENARFIRSYFDAMHGHFFAAKYFDVFPDAAFIATLRHPVSRVISQYFHELNDAGPSAWYHQELASGRMDIVEFSEQQGVSDSMARHLAGRDLQDYAVLLISEYFAQSCYLLSRTVRPLSIDRHFGTPPQLPKLNEATSRPKFFEIDQQTREAIFARTRQDVEVYKIATQLLRDRIARLQ